MQIKTILKNEKNLDAEKNHSFNIIYTCMHGTTWHLENIISNNSNFKCEPLMQRCKMLQTDKVHAFNTYHSI